MAIVSACPCAPSAIDIAVMFLSVSYPHLDVYKRQMYTHHTGLQKNGWAFTFSASRRWAQEAYLKGTSFDAYSGYISIAKVLNTRHQITLNIIAAESQRARSGAVIDEVYALAQDNYYNPNWGWQAAVSYTHLDVYKRQSCSLPAMARQRIAPAFWRVNI